MNNNNLNSAQNKGVVHQKKKIIKKRNWAFILYPESAPADWKDVLQMTGLSIAISPLHDKDLDPIGEKKKEHYHVILCYSGPTSYNVVANITSSLNGSIPIALEQIKGMYRYLTHRDNPEKYQYKPSDIILLNGFSAMDVSDLSKSEILTLKGLLLDLILEKGFREYISFLIYVKTEYGTCSAEFDVASTNTYLFDKIITSSRYVFSKKRLEN